MSANPEVQLTLEDCVDEVLGLLTGLDLSYLPEQDRFRAITRQLNRALRSNALEKEWSWYSSTTAVGTVTDGMVELIMDPTVRPRIINDDAVRLIDDEGRAVRWAYFLPRDSLHKYSGRSGLWAAHTRDVITFSRPLTGPEVGLTIHVPTMREPEMFRLPETGDTPVPAATLDQLLDFFYPDVVVLRAAYYYAQTDPVMQPRVQTLEAQYKDLMYQLIERDDRNTDSPFQNEFFVPVQNGIHGYIGGHGHPHSDDRR